MKSSFVRPVIWFVTLLMIMSVAPNAYASEMSLQAYDGEITNPYADELPDNDDLFAGYVNNEFYGSDIQLLGASAREQLSEAEKSLYDFLKDEIEDVADGEEAVTVFTADEDELSEWNAKNEWTLKDLGVTALTDGNVNILVQKMADDFFAQFNIMKVINAFLSDCPYDLYWYDKTLTIPYSRTPDFLMDGRKYAGLKIVSFSLYFRVVPEYQPYGYDASNPRVDVSKTSATKKAVKNARALVKEASDMSDYDKLCFYRNEICSRVVYDTNAASGNSGSYGSPWQLINVFDEDADTNVVCEGYSKAFQYLFDCTNFENEIKCYTVFGTMDGGVGAGAHMWNIVTMEDGENYLVDLTNCDDGAAGMYGGLFLSGAGGSVTDGYEFVINSVQSIMYEYDEDYGIGFWGAGDSSILKLAKHKYGYNGIAKAFEGKMEV